MSGRRRAGPRRLSVWPPLSPAVHVRSRSRELPFPLGASNCRLFARARHGLFHGARALGLERGDEVLAPAFHHGSEIEALVRAGLSCRFYDLGPDLQPDEAEVESLLGPRVRALYLIHPLGIPVDPPRWRSWCDRRGILLLEDAAQAWLSTWEGRPVGSFGDLAVFCLYKTFGVPDGAALMSRRPPAPLRAPHRAGSGPMLRRHGAWVAARSSLVSRFGSEWKDPARHDHLADIDLGDPHSAPSRATERSLARLPYGHDAAARRRANYRGLVQRLGELVPEELRLPPKGSSPFALPVASPDKDELCRRLAGHGIDALSFWTHPHPELPAEGFPGARRLRGMAGLPVHQELRPGDLERIAGVTLHEARAVETST